MSIISFLSITLPQNCLFVDYTSQTTIYSFSLLLFMSAVSGITNHLSVLEGEEAEPTTYDLTQYVNNRLGGLDKKFMKHHYQPPNLTNEAEVGALANEKRELDSQ